MPCELPKLGKNRPVYDHRTLQLAKYTDKLLPPPPSAGGWNKKLEWPMMLNDTLGDCTCAAAGHMIEQWTDYTETSDVIVPDSAIETAYSAVSGYIPGDPSTDNGANCIDVLNYWHKTGVGGHKIEAYAQVAPTDINGIKNSILLFGNLYIGIALPISAQGASRWTVPHGGPVGDGAPGSWGGHACPIIYYNSSILTVVTWGSVLNMTWDFFAKYVDECYAVISPDWFKKNQLTPSGLNTSQLLQDLSSL